MLELCAFATPRLGTQIPEIKGLSVSTMIMTKIVSVKQIIKVRPLYVIQYSNSKELDTKMLGEGGGGNG